jgi:uncharacterized damage-inducible protein DinB
VEFENYLQKLFAYDDWANREALASIERAVGQPERALKLLDHIIGAEWVWMERMRGVPQPMPVWPDLNPAQCRQNLDSLKSGWQKVLQENSGRLDRDFSYKNSKGEDWHSRMDDVLMHVIMHSAYHRGQIAIEVRRAGSEPAYTDFIHAMRKGLVKQP